MKIANRKTFPNSKPSIAATAAALTCSFLLSACTTAGPVRRISSSETVTSARARPTAVGIIEAETFRLLLLTGIENPAAYQRIMSQLDEIDWSALEERRRSYRRSGWAGLGLIILAESSIPNRTSAGVSGLLGLSSVGYASSSAYVTRRRHRALIQEEIQRGSSDFARTVRQELSFFSYVFDLTAAERRNLENAVTKQIHQQTFLSRDASLITVDVFQAMVDHKIISQNQKRIFVNIRDQLQIAAERLRDPNIDLAVALSQEDVLRAYHELLTAIRAELLRNSSPQNAQSRQRMDAALDRADRVFALIEATGKVE